MKKIYSLFLVTLAFHVLFASTLLFGTNEYSAAADVKGAIPRASDLKDDQLLEIVIKIWQNQNGVWNEPDDMTGITSEMKKGITDWENNYAMIGIGQCIWYPAAEPKIFQEDWPRLAQFLKENGFPMKKWMLGSCPWPTREAFFADFDGPRLTWLRNHLAKKHAVILQARCIAQRLDEALPKIIDSIDQDFQNGILTREEKKQKEILVTDRFKMLATLQEPFGFYALMDYVHFDGEGVLSTERQNGVGWGLRQALEMMDAETISTQGALQAFVDAAIKIYPDQSGIDYATQRYNTYLTFSLEK